jgi:hypothetical protein
VSIQTRGTRRKGSQTSSPLRSCIGASLFGTPCRPLAWSLHLLQVLQVIQVSWSLLLLQEVSCLFYSHWHRAPHFCTLWFYRWTAIKILLKRASLQFLILRS